MTAVLLLILQSASWTGEVSPGGLEGHSREIVRHLRPSGSPGEFAAIDYIVSRLEAEGVPVEVHELSAYVSDPVRASFRVESEPPLDFPALTALRSKFLSSSSRPFPREELGALRVPPSEERLSGVDDTLSLGVNFFRRSGPLIEVALQALTLPEPSSKS